MMTVEELEKKYPTQAERDAYRRGFAMANKMVKEWEKAFRQAGCSCCTKQRASKAPL